MATQSKTKSWNIKEAILEAIGKGIDAAAKNKQQQFWFSGDASTTDFEMQAGWKPLHVFNAGSLQKEGSGDEYEVTFDGHLYTVSFNVAPGSGNDIGVIGVMA